MRTPPIRRSSAVSTSTKAIANGEVTPPATHSALPISTSPGVRTRCVTSVLEPWRRACTRAGSAYAEISEVRQRTIAYPKVNGVPVGVGSSSRGRSFRGRDSAAGTGSRPPATAVARGPRCRGTPSSSPGASEPAAPVGAGVAVSWGGAVRSTTGAPSVASQPSPRTPLRL